jgi:hypothetical protein
VAAHAEIKTIRGHGSAATLKRRAVRRAGRMRRFMTSP